MIDQLINYLKVHSLAELRAEHGVRFHICGHLISLAYDQFESSNTNPIANLCRGLVIAREDGSDQINPKLPFGNVALLAFPVVRFFNYNHDAKDSFEPISVVEKLDGTCCVVYYDKFNDQFNVATRNVPDASNKSNDGMGITFRELFARAILDNYGLTWKDFETRLSSGHTYVFELMTPDNIVVVRHNTYKATLLSIRSLHTGRELNIEQQNQELQFDLPISHPELLHLPFDEIAAIANELDPLHHEGFIVLGSNFERIKIKSERYVTHNKVHDLTKYDLLNHILTEKIDDYYPMMTDYQKLFANDLSQKVANWAKITNKELETIAGMSFPAKKYVAFYISDKILNCHSKYIFQSYNEETCSISANLELSAILKPLIESESGRFSDRFLRLVLNNWL